MAEETKNYKIHSSNPNFYRLISSQNLQKSVEAAHEAIDQGQDVGFALLGPLMTIIEGDGTPFGVIPNQDISLKRAKLFKSELKPKEGEPWRASLKDIHPAKAQQLLIADKAEKLRALGQEPTPETVSKAYNIALPGTQYSDMLHETLNQIVSIPANKEVKDLMDGLFKAYRESRGIK